MESISLRKKEKKVNYAVDSEDDMDIDDPVDDLEMRSIAKKGGKKTPGKKTKKADEDSEEDDEEFEASDSDEEAEDEESVEESGDDVEDKIKTGKKRQADSNLETPGKGGAKETKTKKGKAPKESKAPKEVKVKEVKVKAPKKVKLLLDPEYNHEERYFYQDLEETQCEEIRGFILSYLIGGKNDEIELRTFFAAHPKLKKGDHNVKKLKTMYN